MADPLTPEEEVIREWVAAMTRESGAPLPPSLRRAEPLPRRRVLPVVQTLLGIIDDLRAAPPPEAGLREAAWRAHSALVDGGLVHPGEHFGLAALDLYRALVPRPVSPADPEEAPNE